MTSNIAPQIIIGTCAPNNVGEMISELLTRKIAYIPGEKCVRKSAAEIEFKHNKKHLQECNGGYSNVLIQKSPIFSGYFVSNKPYFLHSCVRNLTESIYRQYSALVSYDEKEVYNYKQYVVNAYIQPIIKESLNHQFPKFDEWLSRYSGKQLLKYQKAYQEYIEKPQITREDVMKMLMHSKTDEKVFIDYSTNKPKIKSRTVIEQLDTIKVIMGPFISFVSKISKIVDQTYGSGLNFEERCHKFEKWIDILGDYVVVCIDGSAFDSTQWEAIMLALDTELYDQLIELHKNDILQYCDVELLKLIIREYNMVVHCKIAQFFKNGTVPSGKMNTSDGNTRRSSSYVRYGAMKANLIYGVDFFCECCGDDIIIFIKRKQASRLIESLEKFVYLKDNIDKSHGLGQIAKKFDIYDSIADAEYLSCYFLVNSCNKIKMIRKPERFLQLTPWTKSNNQRDIHKSNILNKELSLGDAMELMSWCGDIELYAEYAKMLARFGGIHGIRENDKSYMYSAKIDTRSDSFNDAFIQMLYKKFNIDYGTYKSFLNVIKNIKSDQQYITIHHEFIDYLFFKNSFSTDINLTEQLEYLNKYQRQGVYKIKMNSKKFSIDEQNNLYDTNSLVVREFQAENGNVLLEKINYTWTDTTNNDMIIDDYPQTMNDEQIVNNLINTGRISDAQQMLFDDF
jgi:transcription antitermination factor NusG